MALPAGAEVAAVEADGAAGRSGAEAAGWLACTVIKGSALARGAGAAVECGCAWRTVIGWAVLRRCLGARAAML